MSFHSTIMPTRLFGIRHLEIRMSLGMSRDQFSALGFFSSAVLCGQLLWTKAMFCKRLWVILRLSKCNILRKCHFYRVFPIIAQSRDRKCKFLYTFREGSSRWTKWYITLVDTLPNKNVRGGAESAPPLYVRVTKIDLYVRVLMHFGSEKFNMQYKLSSNFFSFSWWFKWAFQGLLHFSNEKIIRKSD